jgi:hypothetical protein
VNDFAVALIVSRLFLDRNMRMTYLSLDVSVAGTGRYQGENDMMRSYLTKVNTAAVMFGFSMALVPVSSGIAAASVRPTAPVALEGQTAPGTGGATFTDFDEPFVNTAGDETFNACYTGGSGDGCGTFLRRGGVLSPIVVSGQTVPGGVGAVTFTYVGDIDGPTFNNKSTVGLVVRNGNNGNTGAVLQKKLNGSLTVIAKNGDTAPGTSGVFADFDDMAQNNNDDFAFIATYTEDSGATFKTGVFLKPSSGAMVPIVLNGDTLPSTGGGTQCGTYTGDIDGPWMNDSQTVAFIADEICGGTVDSGSAFVKPSGMALQPLVLKGDPAPSAIGGTIDDVAIGRPGLNNSNVVGFKAEIGGGSVGFAILTKQIGGSPVPCVLGGSSAPGTTGTFSDFDPPAINQNGLLSIESSVTGDATVSKGIFTCRNGAVNAIALEGDPKPGTASTFGDDVSDASLSDNGKVTFIDTVSPTGVFVNVLAGTPAPTLSHTTIIGLAVFLAGFGWLALRRRQA